MGIWFRWEPWVSEEQNKFRTVNGLDLDGWRFKHLPYNSPDGLRLIPIPFCPEEPAVLEDARLDSNGDNVRLFKFPHYPNTGTFGFLDNDTILFVTCLGKENGKEKGEFFRWHRRRPEYWWGLAWLPEFWLALIFGGAFAWSVRRDRKELYRRNGEVPA
jgi:hypothetical protein